MMRHFQLFLEQAIWSYFYWKHWSLIWWQKRRQILIIYICLLYPRTCISYPRDSVQNVFLKIAARETVTIAQTRTHVCSFAYADILYDNTNLYYINLAYAFIRSTFITTVYTKVLWNMLYVAVKVRKLQQIQFNIFIELSIYSCPIPFLILLELGYYKLFTSFNNQPTWTLSTYFICIMDDIWRNLH